MNPILRPFESGDLPAIARLHQRVHGRPLDEAEWRWKYDANPFGRLSFLAHLGGEAMAFYGGWWLRLRGSEGSREVLEVSDSMTDPAARVAGHRPLLQSVHEAFIDAARGAGIAFCFGCPNRRALRLGKRFLQYEEAGPLVRWTASLEPFGAADEPPFVRVSDTFPEGHGPLADELHARPGWRVDRGRGASNWRYHARPERYYRVFHVGPDSARAAAFAVVVTVGPLAQLLDLQWTREDGERWLRRLLGLLARDLAPAGVATLELGGRFSADESALLERLGLESAEDGNRLVAEPIPEARSAMPTLSLRWGDLDYF